MQFFLYEIVARIVAIYLCFDCSRRLWNDLQGAYFNPSVLDWWSIRYWIRIGGQIFTVVACLVVAILGWWHPNS